MAWKNRGMLEQKVNETRLYFKNRVKYDHRDSTSRHRIEYLPAMA